MNLQIPKVIQQNIYMNQQILENQNLQIEIQKVVDLCIDALKSDKKILFCGNGGSASDAQHLAAELSGRFYLERKPLFAEALHVNTSYLTAVANDYGYDDIYARLIRAKGRSGDVLFAMSTSGNSPNIVKAIHQANEQGVSTIGMTGESGGAMKSIVNILLNMPSVVTPRIQEAHILVGHIICELVEAAFEGTK